MATARYGNVPGYKAYHLERNNDIPVSSDEDIDASLLVASEWVDANYRSGFGGLKVDGRSQEREWPRSGAMDIYGYGISPDFPPLEVIYATYEAAWRNIVTPGILAQDYSPSKYKRAAVEGAVSAEWATFNSVNDVQIQFRAIDNIIAPILTSNPMLPSFSGLSGSITRV